MSRLSSHPLAALFSSDRTKRGIHTVLVVGCLSMVVPAYQEAIAEQASSNAPAADVTLFQREVATAMTKMMSAMAIEPTNNVDRDFVAMMVPHHQGAIDMAISELRYGKSEYLRRIAQEIVVDQTQEIVAMKLAIGERMGTAPEPILKKTEANSGERSRTRMQMEMCSGMKH